MFYSGENLTQILNTSSIQIASYASAFAETTCNKVEEIIRDGTTLTLDH